MKKFRQIIKINVGLIFLLFCWLQVFPQNDQSSSLNEAPIANNGQPVNDFANVIDDATEQQLNQKIKDFKARTNPQVVLVVATVRTTGDRPIFDYSLAVYRGWKIGGSGDDNPGALLFVAVDDRKYFTQVGRDLEDELPDGLVGQLQRQYLVPAFKQGDYSKGISDTIDAYIKTIEAKQKGETVPSTQQTEPTPQKSEPATQKKSGSTAFSGGICCLVGLIVILIFIFTRSGGGGGRNGRNRWGGGGGFGGGGALPWIIGSILAGSGGSSGGSSGDSSWGGGGGGSDWGGFGGGGDAGGGGAGGDW